MVSQKGGKQLLKLARAAINGKKFSLEGFNQKQGLFLRIFYKKELRDAIGHVQPILTLKQAVVATAKATAYMDPKFLPDVKDKDYKIEITLIDKPVLIKKDYKKEIKLNKHGLILDYKEDSVVLLPQYAKENKIKNVDDFLEFGCLKGGWKKDSWEKPEFKLFKFNVEIFSEK